jgi:hypothetical protein
VGAMRCWRALASRELWQKWGVGKQHQESNLNLYETTYQSTL